jgi:hypothetical protein
MDDKYSRNDVEKMVFTVEKVFPLEIERNRQNENEGKNEGELAENYLEFKRIMEKLQGKRRPD